MQSYLGADGTVLKKNIAVVILAVNLADSLALADRLIRIRNGQIQEIYDQKDFSRLPEHTPWLHLYQKTYGNRSEDKKKKRKKESL